MAEQFDSPLDELASANDDRRVSARRAGLILTGCGVIMVPWAVYTYRSLPHRAVASNVALAWGGFDMLLAGSLLWTGCNAVRPTRWLSAAAASTASLLVVDAWFDVVTSPRGPARQEALVMAVLAELPLAAGCGWLTVHAQQLQDGTLIQAVRRRRHRH